MFCAFAFVASEFWQLGGNETAKLGIKTDFDSETLEGSTDDAPGVVEAEGAVEPPKRGRGRPKGTPKTGGRVKGSPRSYSAPEVRAELLTKSNAIDKLADIAAGRKIFSGAKAPGQKPGWYYPTIEQQQRACEFVVSKVLPDLQATEITGAAGNELFPKIEQLDIRQTAIAILSIAREASFRPASPPTRVIDEQQVLDDRTANVRLRG